MSAGEAQLGKLTKVYLKIKARRAELADAFKTEDDRLKEQQSSVKGALLAHCKTHDVDSVRTSEGLFYRTVRTRYWTSDWESMHKFILAEKIPEMLEKRVNQGVMKQFLEEHPDTMPPGLNVDSEYSISVRKK